ENSAALRRQRQPGRAPELARVEDAKVPVSGGSVPVRVLVPPGPPRAVIVYYHGGGWVLGSVDESDLLGRALAERTGCAVVLAGYRLAPAYRHPAAGGDRPARLVLDAGPPGAGAGGGERRGCKPGGGGGPPGPQPGRPPDQPAGADLSGHRLRPG